MYHRSVRAGMREYFPGHWLRPHIDRTDELVISATIAVAKLPVNKGDVVSEGPDGSFNQTPKALKLLNLKTGQNHQILKVHFFLQKLQQTGDPWPLEVVDFEGRNIRHPHPPRTIFMYVWVCVCWCAFPFM